MKSLLLMSLLTCPILVQAAIYKSVDENGHVTYSNAPIKGGKSKVIVLEPLPTMSAPKRGGSSGGESSGGADFPNVDSQTQQKRDDKRRTILEEELAAEEKLLSTAKAELTAAEQNPRVYKGPKGETLRNVPLYEESIKTAKEQVELHQNNINALKTELSKLK